MQVAFVIDAFARRIVGWRVSRSAQAGFVLDALVANAVKWSLPSWVQAAFWCWWRAPVSSTLIQAAVRNPARSTSRVRKFRLDLTDGVF